MKIRYSNWCISKIGKKKRNMEEVNEECTQRKYLIRSVAHG